MYVVCGAAKFTWTNLLRCDLLLKLFWAAKEFPLLVKLSSEAKDKTTSLWLMILGRFVLQPYSKISQKDRPKEVLRRGDPPKASLQRLLQRQPKFLRQDLGVCTKQGHEYRPQRP